ncbi:citrate lyase holo-[acyl-carrier protein] synthase [Haloimpatiens sp. FM7330]|uniref:citrate lyase holo-[acyl-carrier protein] synthase n=1 Tax=Haloimpatiens sp. FM7330 TaxID=3298610 RepID=UPI00363F8D0C
MYTPKEILDAREKRVEFQNEMIHKFKLPLIAIRVNYPGVNKDNKLTRKLMEAIDKIVSGIFQYDIHCKIIKFSPEGPIILMSINGESLETKKLCIEIEEKHILGRCIDVDVYDEYGKSISRTELGYSERKCYICGEPAHICVRSQKHSQNEIINFIQKKYEEYVETFHEKL